MANQEVDSAKEKREYKFNKLPENIRQMGEQPEKNRIYIEDYVVTYIHQVFQKRQDEAIVIFVGRKGEGQAKDCSFIYGAVDMDLDLLEGSKAFTKETWDEIYAKIYENFPEAQILGWGCGVSMWNSQIDRNVRQIQQKHFSQEEKMLFLEDLSEKEEKIYHWHNGQLEEMSGYVIYYDKNPQMQEYMLKGQPKKSFEAEYHDNVTTTVRDVIHRNEEREEPKKAAIYGIGAALILLTILGANLLVQSTKKIDSLEKTLETLSNATTSITSTPDGEDSSQNKKETQSPATDNSQSQDTKETVKDNGDSQTTKAPAATSGQSQVTEPPATGNIKPQATGETAGTNTQSQVTKAPEQTSQPQTTKSPVTANNKSQTTKSSSTNSSQSNTTQSSRKAKEKKESQTNTQETSALGKTSQSYIVRTGDTLSQIVWRQYHSMKYMDKVKKANKITNEDEIQVGQCLILPKY